ncbi:MAG: efflux RND transporter periplasmic adaptor subunit [Pseudomonadota bacterium]
MKKKIIWIIGILLLVALVGFKLKAGGQAVNVEASKVTKGTIEKFVEETGELMLEDETAVYSMASGKVLEVPNEAGETVKAGEILARIDSSELQLQIKAMEAQKRNIAAKYAEVSDSTQEETIQILKAQVKADEALYEEANRVMDNNRVLYETGAISLDAYKNSVTALASAEAAMETSRNNLALAEKGASGNVKKQYEAQLAEIQANIDRLKLNTADTIIKSPADGVIMTSGIKPGSMVQPGEELFEIGGNSGYYFESQILVEDIAGIKPGSTVVINDEDLGIVNMEGTIRKIYPKAESVISDLGIEQKRVKVEINIENMTPGLRPGYETTLRIITQSRENALLIDEKALFSYQGKDHVFVVENGIARLREVVKGLESDEQIEVLKGLKEGDVIIISPDEALEEGTKVKTM